MPNLNFDSIALTPAYIGDITITFKQRMVAKPVTEPKKDAGGNIVYLDISGNETIVSEDAVSTVLVQVKDDDGTTDKVLMFDGHVEATAYAENGTQIQTATKRFPIGSLPLAMRKDLKAIMNKIRKGYSNGFTGALGTAVRERK